jgi:hypothetical protein
MARDMHSPSTSRESARVNKNPGTPISGAMLAIDANVTLRLGT